MNLFQHGDFTLHSGARSNFKIDCDALTDEDIDSIARIIVKWLPAPVRGVLGIPIRGVRLCNFVGVHLMRANLLKPNESIMPIRLTHTVARC